MSPSRTALPGYPNRQLFRMLFEIDICRKLDALCLATSDTPSKNSYRESRVGFFSKRTHSVSSYLRRQGSATAFVHNGLSDTYTGPSH